jgi:hypothetical protein
MVNRLSVDVDHHRKVGIWRPRSLNRQGLSARLAPFLSLRESHRLPPIALVAVIMVLIFVSPTSRAQAQSSPGSNCPPDAMTIALQLSAQVNQQKLPNLNSSSTDQQIANEINKLDPIITASSLRINVPALNASNLKGLAVLVTPFDNFLNASVAVKSSDPSSACNFLAATFILAADVTVLAVGTLSVTAVIAILNVTAQYCDAGCVINVANNVAIFISAHGSEALKFAWAGAYAAWNLANCSILGQCSTTSSSSTVPEFPYQSLGLLIFVGLAATAFLASRRGQPGSPTVRQ